LVAVAVVMLGLDLQHLTADRAAVQRVTETVQVQQDKVTTAVQLLTLGAVVRVRLVEMEMREHLRVQVVRVLHHQLQAQASLMQVAVVGMTLMVLALPEAQAVVDRARLTEHQTVVRVQMV